MTIVLEQKSRRDNQWAIIMSAHLSGYGLVRSLRSSGWTGHIVCLQVNEKRFALVQLLAHQCQVIRVRLNYPRDLIAFLNNAFPKNDLKYLFLTDERYHRCLQQALQNCEVDNVVFKLGSPHIDMVLDRLQFYDILHKHHLASAPQTIDSDQDPIKTFGGRFFLRFRQTWNQMIRRPRNQPIFNKAQLIRLESELTQNGLQREEWCYQEMLSVAEKANVSVCGWHDPKNHDYLVTRKVLQHPPTNGNGDVVERIDGYSDLKKTTQRILDFFDYDGPFELEFVLDDDSGEYKVIELNPRFWLQHNLADACTGQALVSRYTGIYPKSSKEQKRYWVNGLYALRRLLHFDLRVLPYLLRAPVKVPRLIDAFELLPLMAIQYIFGIIGKSNNARKID